MGNTDRRLHDVMTDWLAESDNEDTAGLRAFTLAHIRALETALAATPNPSVVPALVELCREAEHALTHISGRYRPGTASVQLSPEWFERLTAALRAAGLGV